MPKHLPDQRPSTWGLTILVGLGRAGKHVYGGTVPAETVTKRRQANRVARKSRKVNRGRR